ncbi:MAG: hypothetical protein NZ920_04385 [Aigarchaeota archaeon]|nr:hypothetical protein [Aigarchaeota archaeon]MDW8092142.1 hypothetical protein [Nitrososphaerota archaeon]
MPRTTLAVDSRLAESLSEIAKARRVTLYALVNNLIENSISLLREGVDIKSISELWSVYKMMSQVEGVIVPGEIFDYLVAALYETKADELKERFRRLGYDIGTILKLYAGTPEELVKVGVTFLKYLPVKGIEYKNLGDNAYEIAIVGVGRRMETTLCMNEFLHGLLEAYKVQVVNEEITQGFVRIRFINSSVENIAE